jgi:hypothetical protein
MIEPFFNKILIKGKTNNIQIHILKPKYEKDIQDCNYKNEGLGNGYYTVLKSNDNIRMYYRGGTSGVKIDTYHTESTCYSESLDGLNFYRPDNHMLFKNGCSHNFFPFIFKNELYGIGGTKTSMKGLKLLKYDKTWNILKDIVKESVILKFVKHENHFDSQNTLVYNQHFNKYFLYLRHNDKIRMVQYSMTEDLVNFSPFKLVNFNNYNDEIYTPNFFPYPNSKYLIGFPSTHNQSKLFKQATLSFTNDGINWNIVDFNLCDIKDSYMLANGIIESEKMKKIFCYPYLLDKGILQCYSWDFHRIQEIKCDELGKIKFGPFKISSNKIKINCKTNTDGFIKVNLFENEKLITTSKFIKGNIYFDEINWISKFEVEPTKNYDIEFELFNASLFSISFE